MLKQKVKASETLALIQEIKNMTAKGIDVVSFAAGEPDFDTPEVVVSAAFNAIKAGRTRYEPTPGIPELREAVADDYRKRLKASWVKSGNVIVTAGAKQGIYLALAGLLEQGDEVLIPAPYWVSYPEVVISAGGEPVILETQEKNKFFPTVEELEKHKNSRTRGLIFSSPCNPTGMMITRDHLKSVIQWCVKNKVVLIYDELYERLLLDSKIEHVSATELCSEAESEYVISVNALSKTSAMTGWRLGYLVSHAANISALSPLQGQMLTSLPGFIQMAAKEGLSKASSFLPEFVSSFRRRRDLAIKEFSKVPGCRVMVPEGAFYLAVNVEDAMKILNIKNDEEFSHRLLKEKHVAFLWGSASGMPGWIRISFATSDEQIVKGISRIADFVLGR
jgi:aspartate aminotransferase